MGFEGLFGGLFLVPNPNRAWIRPEFEYTSGSLVPMKEDVAAVAAMDFGVMGLRVETETVCVCVLVKELDYIW